MTPRPMTAMPATMPARSVPPDPPLRRVGIGAPKSVLRAGAGVATGGGAGVAAGGGAGDATGAGGGAGAGGGTAMGGGSGTANGGGASPIGGGRLIGAPVPHSGRVPDGDDPVPATGTLGFV